MPKERKRRVINRNCVTTTFLAMCTMFMGVFLLTRAISSINQTRYVKTTCNILDREPILINNNMCYIMFNYSIVNDFKTYYFSKSTRPEIEYKNNSTICYLDTKSDDMAMEKRVFLKNPIENQSPEIICGVISVVVGVVLYGLIFTETRKRLRELQDS